MNTGIADGHNLGWKLGWVARGLAGESLLATYAEERYPVGLHNALASLEAFAPGARSRPQPRLRCRVRRPAGIQPAAEAPAPENGAVENGAVVVAAPGARAPHAWVWYGGERRSTIDLFEGRLTLLTGPRGEAWRDAAKSVPDVPVQVLVVGQDVLDPSGDLEQRYRLGDDDAVLVRPDGHVAWRLPAGDDLRAPRSSHHHPRPPAGRHRLRPGRNDNHDHHLSPHRPRRPSWPTSTTRSARRAATTSRPSTRSARRCGRRSRLPTCCCRSSASATPRRTGRTCCTSHPTAPSPLVALVWLPGQATAIHDHLAWCVVGVHEGAEHETRYRLTGDGRLVESGSAVAFPGDVAGPASAGRHPPRPQHRRRRRRSHCTCTAPTCRSSAAASGGCIPSASSVVAG